MDPITIIYDQEPKPELSKEKQTALGLYVTSKEAYANWKANPEKIKILDVRTLEEYLYIGHPAMAWNVHVALQSYEWDAERMEYPFIVNPEFLNIIKTLFDPSDIIMATCRSGGRSAVAVNMLAQAGYKNVYNITDGFEGDLVDNPESLFNGQRMVNGWKNSGLPWTYSIDPKLIP